MKKQYKNSLSTILLVSALVAGGAGIRHGSRVKEINEITSTYQGYTIDEAKTYLVFDDKIKEARNGLPKLVISGRPDTLKIGKKYTVKYSVKNWENLFPRKIQEIKYSEK